MAVVTVPPYLPNSMYRPNVFVTSQTTNIKLEIAVASIFVNGSIFEVTSMRKPPYLIVGGAPETYFFEFDVSKILQTISAPSSNQMTSIFAKNLNTNYNWLNTECRTDVGLVISYLYIDPTTGLLTTLKSGTPPVIVQDIIPYGNYSTIGTRQTLDYMGLDSYVLDFPTVGGVYDRYWLTNLPNVYPQAAVKTNNPIPICSSDNLTMSYIPTASTNVIRVVIYDENQNFINPAGFISVTPNTTYTPITIGVGIPQLSATSISPALTIPISNLPVGYHYSIQAGQLIMAGFIPQGVKYMFKVVDCCANKVRLHWMNRLGGSDAYTFTNYKKISQVNNSQVAQKPMTWINSIASTYTFDKGRFKIQQTVLKQYEAESIFYDVSWGEWLAELLSSPEVYMETSSGLVAVVINDSEIVTDETNQVLNVKIVFSEANNISVQQN